MIRIGIVGCGRILAAHLRGYRLLREAGVDDFRISALCARRREDAESYVVRGQGPPQRAAVSQIAGDPLSIGDEYLSDFQPDQPVEIFTDYHAMIGSGLIDTVNDFTSHELHHQVAAAALSADLDLLTQKPLAVSVRAADAMCRLAESRQRVFGVFENFRHLPITRQLQWLFGGGPGGALQMVWIGYVGAWWAPDQIVAHTPWRHRRIDGGGISLDLGVHFFDQIRSVAGDMRSVSARVATLEPRRFTRDAQGNVIAQIDCDSDDTCIADFDTQTGAIGSLTASWAGHAGATTVADGAVWYGCRGRVAESRFSADDGSSTSLSDLYRCDAPRTEQQLRFPFGLDDSFALAQHDWLEAIRQRRAPETSGREGMIDLASAFTILESAHAGRRVEVAEVLSGELREYQRAIDARWGF